SASSWPLHSPPCLMRYFFFQAEDGIRDRNVTGVQTCALPIFDRHETTVYLDYMRSPEAAQIQVDGGFMPVNADVDVQVDGLGAQGAEGFRSVIDGAGVVPFPDYAAPGMTDKLTAGVQGMITGHMEPEEYLDSLQSEWASYHD